MEDSRGSWRVQAAPAAGASGQGASEHFGEGKLRSCAGSGMVYGLKVKKFNPKPYVVLVGIIFRALKGAYGDLQAFRASLGVFMASDTGLCGRSHLQL